MLALVLVVIGYRLFQVKESAPSFADVTAALPAGAKVLSTAVGADHIVVTIEVDGVTEAAHLRSRIRSSRWAAAA